jgi:acyl-CoA thioesterase
MPIAPATIETGNQISLLKTLGIHLVEIGESHAVMTVTINEKHLNYLGGAHGGLLAALIDTVSFFPQPLLPSGVICTTTNLNVSYIRPASVGDILTARSELVYIGRNIASVNSQVINHEFKLIAHGTATLMILSE